MFNKTNGNNELINKIHILGNVDQEKRQTTAYSG